MSLSLFEKSTIDNAPDAFTRTARYMEILERAIIAAVKSSGFMTEGKKENEISGIGTLAGIMIRNLTCETKNDDLKQWFEKGGEAPTEISVTVARAHPKLLNEVYVATVDYERDGKRFTLDGPMVAFNGHLTGGTAAPARGYFWSKATDSELGNKLRSKLKGSLQSHPSSKHIPGWSSHITDDLIDTLFFKIAADIWNNDDPQGSTSASRMEQLVKGIEDCAADESNILSIDGDAYDGSLAITLELTPETSSSFLVGVDMGDSSRALEGPL